MGVSVCHVGTSTAPLTLSVDVLGGHKGVHLVTTGGIPLPHTSEGDIPLAGANQMIGQSISIKSTIEKVAAGKNFTVRHVITGLPVPFPADDAGSFDDGQNIETVTHTMSFEA